MKLSYPPLIVLGCIAVQILLNMLVPLEVNLSLLLGLIVLILSLGIITYAFRELSNNETTYIPKSNSAPPPRLGSHRRGFKLFDKF